MSLMTSKSSPIHIAALYVIMSLIRECLARGTDGNQRDANGATAMMLAAAMNRLDIVRFLLQTGTTLETNAVDNKGRSALFYAGQGESVELFRSLLEHPAVDVNSGMALSIGERYAAMLAGTPRLLLAHPEFSLHEHPRELVIEFMEMLAYNGLDEELEMLASHPGFQIKGADDEDLLERIYNCIFTSKYVLGWFPRGISGFPSIVLLLEKTVAHVDSL